MWGIVIHTIERRRAVLIDHGRDGWHMASDRASDLALTEAERGFWARFKSVIEDKLEIDWQPDTATRYLEPHGANL